MNTSEHLSQLQAHVAEAAGLPFRLVWLAGGAAPERTNLLRELARVEGGRFVNLGGELSRRLIEIPADLRPVSVAECLDDCLGADANRVVCLDRMEILFEPDLRINPVVLIKARARRLLLVAGWPGAAAGGGLVFGPVNHPAHLTISEHELESPVYRM